MRPRVVLLALALTPSPGRAQETDIPGGAGPRFQLEATTDERARGLSWSAGKPAATLGASVPLTDGFEASAAATTLRGSARHGKAEVMLRLGADWSRDLGSGWRLGLGAGGYIFTGRGDLNFAELEARAVWSLGPARLRAGARFAPVQAAIGGSNLHLSLDGDVGLPGTPVTLMGGLGHSTGTVTEPLRAQRFRPEGAYWNYSLGAEYVAGPAVLGVRWTGNSIGAAPAGPFADPHVGSRLAGYIRLDF